MVRPDNHRINITIPKKLHKDFVSAYPSCLSTFIRNALSFAVQKKQNFDLIFFKEFSK